MGKVTTRSTEAMSGLKNLVENLPGKAAKVGWFESAKYEDGTPVAYIAAIQELGVPERSIPPRPTMRPTAAEKGSTEWAKVMGEGATAVAEGRATVQQIYDTLGLLAAADVRKAISELTTPELSPVTLLARKARYAGERVAGKKIGELHREASSGPVDLSGVSTKPLVDSGIMVATLTNQTEDV